MSRSIRLFTIQLLFLLVFSCFLFAIPPQCVISGTSYPDGTVNPANSCQVCNVGLNPTAWSNRSNGTTCDDDGNACTQDSCQAGTCAHLAWNDGTACNDGNACTQTDTCQSGACIGSNPVTCAFNDQCHDAGTCNPATGMCSNPAKTDGTNCNDGNACTQTDSCQAGVCSGSNPVTCTASDQCHFPGTCNPSTGICSNPASPNGTACNDGDACSQTDTCQAGFCTGANPVTCSALDQCHMPGTCDPSIGICSNPAKADGTPCSDGNACTQTDACQSGTCIGNNPVLCTALDACHSVGTCNLATGVCSNPTSPDCGQLFANGSFETGTSGVAPPSWTVSTYLNAVGLTVTTPQTLSGLNLATGGVARTTIKNSASGMLSQPDVDLGLAASLRWPRYGNQAVIVNEHGNNKNVNILSQTVIVASGDIDPADNKIHIRFVFAPILQNPQHAAAQQPYYFILVTNVTQGTVLYQDFNLSGSTVLWKSINTGLANELDYTDWQLVDVAPADSALKVGDQVQLQIVAAGCQPSAHFGEVWVDGVGVTVPGISVEGSGTAQANAGSNITYALTYRNGAAIAEDNVILTFTTPPNTTFESITNPLGFTCTAPDVGIAGDVVCTIGTLVPEASGSISVTVNVTSGTTATTVVQRNYSIASTQETALLGPSITTQVGCTTDSQCSAGNWCNESTSTCAPQLVNGDPIPSDPLHSNPTLNGTCTASAGALVCTSGVCDPSNNTCGYANGDGTCNASTSTTVCSSGVCDADGKCGLANTDGPCTVATGGTVCRSGACDADGKCGLANSDGPCMPATGGMVCRSGACSANDTCEPAGGCNVDADCSASNWCNEAAHVCTPKVANGSPLPTDPAHTNPALNGTCTPVAGSLVCQSGVCDPSNNACGYANGDGPCTPANGGIVCRSGMCSVNGTCEPLGGCNADADCNAGNWCNEAVHACTPQVANGSPIPTDPAHSSPTLNGTCTPAVGSLVCQSGVCDPSNNACGYVNGDGPCTPANGGVVCRSGMCSVNGTCEPLGGCNADADCNAGNWCNEAVHACTPQVANGSPISTDPAHSNPALNGTCTVGSGLLVCQSGVCDASDNSCGYAIGDGPCNQANAGMVCRFGVCGANGTCAPASFVVTTAQDSSSGDPTACPAGGPSGNLGLNCTLRDALAAAASAGAGDITFSSAAFPATNTAAQNTIFLSSAGTLNIPLLTTITGPAPAANGAAVAVDGGQAYRVFAVGLGISATISNLTVQNGYAQDSGGAIYNQGTLNVTNSTFSGNSASGSGGAIENVGTLTASYNTFSGNSAGVSGGAILNGGTLTLTSSTLSGNFAATSGGGIFDGTSGTLKLANSIVDGNRLGAPIAPGQYNDFDDLGGSTTFTIANGNLGGNVIGNYNSTTAIAPSPAINLAPLSNYSGPAQTMVPLPSSPALCAGLPANVPTGMTADQRGLANSNAGYPGYSNSAPCVDAGAVQTNYSIAFTTQPPSSVHTDTNFAAALTLSESGSVFTATGSTLPLTLALSSGSGTLSGTTPTIVQGVASYQLQISSTTSSDALAATLALNSTTSLIATSSSFEVQPASPSIQFSLSPATQSYGVAFPSSAIAISANINGTALSGDYSYTYTPAGDTVAQLLIPGTTVLPAGDYLITATIAASANYTTASLTASYTVDKATLTVQASDASMTYGTALPTLGGTVSGMVAGDAITAAYSTTATTSSPVGSYPITPALSDPNLRLANYSVNSFVNGTLTISKASSQATLSASAAAVLLKNSLTLTAKLVSSTTGMPSGSVSFLDGTTSLGSSTLDASGTATLSVSTLAVGSHSITAAYAGDTNFTAITSSAATALVQDFQVSGAGSGTTLSSPSSREESQPIRCSCRPPTEVASRPTSRSPLPVCLSEPAQPSLHPPSYQAVRCKR